MDAKSYGKLTVKLPLGNKQKFTNFAIASKAAYAFVLGLRLIVGKHINTCDGHVVFYQ
jgi:hypothetical protein